MATRLPRWRAAHLQWVKYLGMEIDLEATGPRAHQTLLQKIKSHLSHLLQQPASPEAKIDYIRFKLLPIFLATAKCANWTLKAYRELDVPFNDAYRRILALPKTVPVTLLHLPTSHGGMGLTRLSDRAQVHKWHTFLRCSSVGKDAAASVDGLFSNISQTQSTSYDYIWMSLRRA